MPDSQASNALTWLGGERFASLSVSLTAERRIRRGREEEEKKQVESDICGYQSERRQHLRFLLFNFAFKGELHR